MKNLLRRKSRLFLWNEFRKLKNVLKILRAEIKPMTPNIYKQFIIAKSTLDSIKLNFSFKKMKQKYRMCTQFRLRQPSKSETAFDSIRKSLVLLNEIWEDIIMMKENLFHTGVIKNNIPIPALNITDVINMQISNNYDFPDILKLFSSPTVKYIMNALSEFNIVLNECKNITKILVQEAKDPQAELKRVTREARNILYSIKQRHEQLQQADEILKYNLEQKRALISSLKEQLENTKESFDRSVMKNNESEMKYQSLRKEFAARRQNVLKDNSHDIKNDISISNPVLLSKTEQTQCENNEDKDIDINESEIHEPSIVKKSRLDVLEEECKFFHSNLVTSTQKREEIITQVNHLYELIGKTAKPKQNKPEYPVENADGGTDSLFNDNSSLEPNKDTKVENNPPNWSVDSVNRPDDVQVDKESDDVADIETKNDDLRLQALGEENIYLRQMLQESNKRTLTFQRKLARCLQKLRWQNCIITQKTCCQCSSPIDPRFMIKKRQSTPER